HPQINGIIPRGESGEVAEHFNLADLRKSFDAFTAIRFAESLPRIHLRHIQRWQVKRPLSGRGLLKDQSLIQHDVRYCSVRVIAHLSPVLERLFQRVLYGCGKTLDL